jgi:type I restriction enzyme R subunit
MWRSASGEECNKKAQVIDFRNPGNNRYLAVRELKIQGMRTPHYNRRADLVCFVNGIPLVFIELKAVYRNIRAGYDNNLSDYADTIPHAFYHNAFLVVSNGDKARYGSITSQWKHFSEWKRQDEKEKGDIDARVLLDGILEKARLLDLVENFVLYDDSRAGGARKIMARNHQVLGVNLAIASVVRQEELKKEYPERFKLLSGNKTKPAPSFMYQRGDSEGTFANVAEVSAGRSINAISEVDTRPSKELLLPLIVRAHPDLGRLGVFWHTQGSGKSYSMLFFAEKVRRTIPDNFTFLVMTDRDDLDDQIHRTFIGCGIADEKTPRAANGKELKRLLQEDHRYIFSLIHKFNQDVAPDHPYSRRDNIIVISDEAHRTQAGKFARNMRMALPNACFIGFTGTPLFKSDHITRRIFGDYISRYDFQRSVDDHSTVRLIYENRGEKLGIARLDLNDRIAEKIEEAELDPDQTALLEKLLGKDYEVITADDRLDKLADDFVDHCSARWQAGKSMLICIDKLTCARMHQRILPRWQKKIAVLQVEANQKATAMAAAGDPDKKEVLQKAWDQLRERIAWMKSTLIHIIISEAQNEVKDFRKWDFDIKPHRALIKMGFETPDGKRVRVEDAFKDPEHPFRIAIVCAMWLTGFDVECLATLYIDKPMKAHNIMQAIARANRIYGDKDCGIIVDYNGVLKSLREALAQYAIGDPGDEGGGGGGGGGGQGPQIVTPIEELLASLEDAISQTEKYLLDRKFDVARLRGARGFDRIEALRDATDALYASDETKHRFEIMAREVFSRFKALIAEPAVYAYAERHDNIEAIYKKLQENRDTADVTEVLKELHKIVNAAIRAQGPGDDQAEGLTVDLSKIDFAKLRDEFAKRARRKCEVLADIRQVVEQRLATMLAQNPLRMDYYAKYQEIVAAYNREKDRATVEQTFADLLDLAAKLDAEQQRAVQEGLSEDELTLFDLLQKDKLNKAARERVKQASRQLLKSLTAILAPMQQWTAKAQTQAEVKTRILDQLYEALPMPPFTEEETDAAAARIYDYVWQRCAAGQSFTNVT